jgi:superfamily II DNA/RNA helicase
LRDIDLHIITLLTVSRYTLILRSFTVNNVQTKKEAHRFYAVLTQLNVKSCELHGDVTQALRYLALQRFRDNEVDVMVRIIAD